jgi:membrane protein implicated in regulation of membrane protease activity
MKAGLNVAWNLRPIEIFYLFCAVIGGLLFIIRIILFVVGGNSDADMDVGVDMDMDGDVDHMAEPGVRLVSVQGVTGFFLMFGLVGLAMTRGGIHDFLTILGGTGAGFITMLAIAWVMFSMTKLQSSGTLQMENTIGKEGKVYLTIPEGGTGKISIAVQGNLREFEAVSTEKSAIPTGETVRVVRILGTNVLVVERVELVKADEF